MHERVLAELHFHHMEPERLNLPYQRLHGPVRGACGTGARERVLHRTQVGQQLFGRQVHDVGVARHGALEACGHHQHDGAVRLEAQVVGHPSRQRLTHLHEMAPQVHKLFRGRGVPRLQREVAPDVAAFLGQLGHHMREVLRRHAARHLRSDVRVAVAVTAHPRGKTDRNKFDGQFVAEVLFQLFVQFAQVIRYALPQAVFYYGKAPFGFIYRAWAQFTDFIGMP